MRVHVTSLIIKAMHTEITIGLMVHDCHTGMVLDQAILTDIAIMAIEEAILEMNDASDAAVTIDEAAILAVIVITHVIVQHHVDATEIACIDLLDSQSL